MKKWGLLISLYYVLSIVLLVVPSVDWLTDDFLKARRGYLWSIFEFSTNWLSAIPLLLLVGAQLLLLFLSVDTSPTRPECRKHILFPLILSGFFLALLGFAACSSLILGIWKEDSVSSFFDNSRRVFWLYLSLWPVLWILWTVLFYLKVRSDENPISRAISWLLKGSVLELLIVVPCHVIVRRRGDCCAPGITGLGISAGLAIMFLAFGPSVLLLYKKRMESYSSRPAQHS